MATTYLESDYMAGLKRGARYRTTNYMGSLLVTSLLIPSNLVAAVDKYFGVCPIKLSSAVKEISLFLTSPATGSPKFTCYLAIDPKIECKDLTADGATKPMTTNLLSGTFVLRSSTTAGASTYQELKFIEESYGHVTLFQRIKDMLDQLKTVNKITDAEISQVINLWKMNEGKPVYICFAITSAAQITDVSFQMLSVYGSPSEMHLTAPMIEPVPGSNI